MRAASPEHTQMRAHGAASAVAEPLEAGNSRTASLSVSAASRLRTLEAFLDFSERLQKCKALDEATQYLQKALPGLLAVPGGALYLVESPVGPLQCAFSWGPADYRQEVAPDSCWATRVGLPHRQPAVQGPQSCAHLDDGKPWSQAGTACYPMSTEAGLTGLLVTSSAVGIESVVEEADAFRERVVVQIGASLGTLQHLKELYEAAVRDGLTGLYNRKFLEESMGREILRATRLQVQANHAGLAVLMLDVDDFKRLNTERGHAQGDLVLRNIAAVLKRHSRGSDVAARYGGDEFTLVLVDISTKLAEERAEAVRLDIATMALALFGKAVGNVTTSVGIAYFPENGCTVQELLHAADTALFAAKRHGGNCVSVSEMEFEKACPEPGPADRKENTPEAVKLQG